MQVFLTGATGFIGSAVAAALVDAGHLVTALSRRPSRDLDSRLRVLPGDLRDPAGWRELARSADAVIHAAIESGSDRLDIDRRFVDAAAGPNLIYTSVMFVLGDTPQADESSPASGPRAEHEAAVIEAGGAVIRPGMVWGRGAWLFENPIVPADGTQRWPLVHRDDLATLYRLVAESGERGIFHGVTEVLRASEVFPEIAPTALKDARRELGSFADALALNQNVMAPRSFALGWRPTRRWR
jgi:nucleoside-diphosphate-sugar epimerase